MYRVLVVDDESIERRGILSLIKKYKYPLITYEAENGKKALDVIDNHDIDILITDIRMPIMDGIELIENLRKKNKDIAIIINSAYSEFEYAKVAVKMKVFNYILKPININEFCSVMTEVIDHCKQQRNEKKNNEILHNKVLFYEKNRVLSDLIYKSVVNSQLRKDAIKLDLSNSIYYLLLVDAFNRLFESHDELFKSIIEENLKSTCYYFNMNEYQCLLVLKSDQVYSKKMLIHTGEAFIEKTRKIHKEDLFLLFSNPIDRIDDIHKEYASLEELLEYKFFTDKGSIIINQEDYITGNNFPVIIDGMLKHIHDYIDYGEFQSVLKSVRLLINSLENTTGLSSIYVKHLFLDIMELIYKKTISYHFFDLHENMKKIMEFNNMKMLGSYILEVIQNISSKYHSSYHESTSGKKVIDDVLALIRREYTEDIGLEYIANQVNLSPNYLSYMFKKTMGESIIKYISKYRLEKSMELLKNTNMKINDISKNVGFSNCTYFVTVFKNEYGSTPSKYRKQLNN